MSRSEVVYLADIRDAVAFIDLFTGEMSAEDFRSDVRTQHACIRNLEVIGEAAKHLKSTTRDKMPDIE